MTSIQFPAEWYPQSAIQITWPHKNSDWADILNEITNCYVELSKEIVKHSKLLIVCDDAKEIEKHFTETEKSRLTLTEIKTNDTWARDHGAITVFKNGEPVLYDFGFNGWGLKFAANHDNQITRKLVEKNIFSPAVSYQNHLNFILEGGAIESDGEGTLLTTSKCMLAPNRNEPLTKEEIENKLIELFGLKRVLWLNHGHLAGDDTDNHIDTLARFCNETTIAYVQCTDVNDEHYEDLKLMEEELSQFRTLRDEPYSLIPLPMAEPVYHNDYRLPATYANFLIMNSVVLMPTYSTAIDVAAKAQLQKAFPDKEIIPVDCRAIIKQHGSLHCITMQYPEGVFGRR